MREKIIDLLYAENVRSDCGIERLADEICAIDPAKHGKWVKLDIHPHLADHKCTACGESAYVPTCMGEPMYLFCPNCGARMRGEAVRRIDDDPSHPFADGVMMKE